MLYVPVLHNWQLFRVCQLLLQPYCRTDSLCCTFRQGRHAPVSDLPGLANCMHCRAAPLAVLAAGCRMWLDLHAQRGQCSQYATRCVLLSPLGMVQCLCVYVCVAGGALGACAASRMRVKLRVHPLLRSKVWSCMCCVCLLSKVCCAVCWVVCWCVVRDPRRQIVCACTADMPPARAACVVKPRLLPVLQSCLFHHLLFAACNSASAARICIVVSGHPADWWCLALHGAVPHPAADLQLLKALQNLHGHAPTCSVCMGVASCTCITCCILVAAALRAAMFDLVFLHHSPMRGCSE
ncbi:hypothetical protein COO60DRAFT_404350 [Scenedesmus sp. NREL 46B-D3]|nr:hypothetical protein COO60DRAFT_404350 [Scenedesmus sp. NREL 46B-D3]